MIKCLICNDDFQFESLTNLSCHIRYSHHISSKQYYDKYIKTDLDGICENCGKPTKFINILKGYAKACSLKCAMPGRAKRNIEKYGYSSNFANPEINQLSHSDLANKKREQTMLKRYGKKSYLATDLCKEQTKQYYQENYGVNHYSQTEEYKNKTKNTMLNTYGVEHNFQLESVKIKNGLRNKTKEHRDKIKQTTLKHFGVDCVFRLKDVQEKAQKNSHTKKALEKRTLSRLPKINEISYKGEQTKRKNGHKSKYELFFEELCVQNNIEFIENYYQDSRYPFLCDYYLPKYDYFIEIFGQWVHNNHRFGTKDSDQELLSQWQNKSKSNKYFNYAINTWYKKDVEKVKLAKKNKITLIILWNKSHILDFFNSDLTKYCNFVDFNTK